MKTHTTTPGLQPLTADDLAYIQALTAKHAEGLEQRCARHRLLAGIRRTIVAACLLVGGCLSYASALDTPQYDQITTSGDAEPQHICSTILLAIEKS
jgi:hypothetical protein